MSEIHIGPHTHGDASAHGHGEPHHTYDREINLKAIGKWMGGLLVLTIIVEVLMLWMVRGIVHMDAGKDPGLTPIEKEMKQPTPPGPRLQVGTNFEKLNPGAETRSDLEDMKALRAAEDIVLDTPAWQDQAQGRLRVPIDVAMKVIARRGVPAEAARQTQAAPTPAPAPPPVPEEQRR